MQENFKNYVDIFTYHKQALNFTFECHDEAGLYYAHLVDKDKDGTLAYWVVKTDPELVEKAKDGAIDMRTLMTTPIGIQEIKIDTLIGMAVRINLDTAVNLYEAELPKPGLCLFNPSKDN